MQYSFEVPDPHAITLVMAGPQLLHFMSILPNDQVLAALKAATADLEKQLESQQAPAAPAPWPPESEAADPAAEHDAVAVNLPVPDVAPGESVTQQHVVELPDGGTITINHTHTNDTPPAEPAEETTDGNTATTAE